MPPKQRTQVQSLVGEVQHAVRCSQNNDNKEGRECKVSNLTAVQRKPLWYAAAKSLQSCLTLCDPIDGSPPGSSGPGILPARIWSGLPFPSPKHACMLSCFSRVQLCATLWTAAHQAPLSMGSSRQEYWNGLPFPSPLWYTALGESKWMCCCFSWAKSKPGKDPAGAEVLRQEHPCLTGGAGVPERSWSRQKGREGSRGRQSRRRTGGSKYDLWEKTHGAPGCSSTF